MVLSQGLIVGCADVPPGPDDQSFGNAAEVLIEDDTTGDRIWIGIDRDATAAEDAFERFWCLHQSGELSWIGGVVVIATNRRLGFFFDPAQVSALAEAAADVETTLGEIKKDPQLFAPASNEEMPLWVVPANVLSVEFPSGRAPTDVLCGTGDGR